jgi:hypothetical protein
MRDVVIRVSGHGDLAFFVGLWQGLNCFVVFDSQFDCGDGVCNPVLRGEAGQSPFLV